MGRVDRRLLLEQRTARRPSPARQAAREALCRLSLAELGALEAALTVLEAGLPLDGPQRAAIDAWERVAPHDAA